MSAHPWGTAAECAFLDRLGTHRASMDGRKGKAPLDRRACLHGYLASCAHRRDWDLIRAAEVIAHAQALLAAWNDASTQRE